MDGGELLKRRKRKESNILEEYLPGGQICLSLALRQKMPDIFAPNVCERTPISEARMPSISWTTF